VEGAALAEFPADLAALGSLDTHEGVRRIGGKVEAYRKQLHRFREHYYDAIDELQRLLEEDRLEDAEEFSHALKGVSGNIGAMALYEKTVAIDSQLRGGNPPGKADIEGLGALLRMVIADIDSLEVPSAPVTMPPGAPLTHAEIMDRLESLAHALEYDLGAAEGLLAELRGGLVDEANARILADISAKADVFAIDEAVALVDVLLERLQLAT
jgi:HPt (histidine-containing phosphotransfer) domain-containing protein